MARLGAALRKRRLEAVYASPLERTRETAKAIAAPQGLTVQIEEAVWEVDYGDWTGRWVSEVTEDEGWRHWNQHRGESRSPGGESMLEIQARTVHGLLRIAEQHQGTVAVVSHGDPVRSAVAYFLGVPLDMFLRIEIDPASVSILQIEKWGVRVQGVNLCADGLR